MKEINYIKKYKLEFFLIVYQMVFLIVNNHLLKVKDTVTLCYLNDFSTGFGPRKLIATLTSFVFGDYVSYNEIRIMALFISVSLMVAFSLFVGNTMRRVEDDKKTTYLYLIVLYLSCSFAVTFLFQWRTFGRMEAWHIIILVGYLLFSLKTSSKIRPLLMLLACVISLVIHHMFISTFLPAYLFLAIYELRKANFEKGLIVRYLLVFTIVAVSFLLLHFVSRTNSMPYVETLAYLNNKTNADVSPYYVKWIYFETVKNHLYEFVIPCLYYNIGSIILSLVLFFPLYLVCYKGIRKAIILTKNLSNGKTIILYFVACLPMLIAYVTASDFGRWTASHFNCFFLFYLYLLLDKNQTANKLLVSLGCHIRTHKFFYMMLPLYLMVFGKNMCKFPDEFIKILDIVLTVFGYSPYYS